MVTVPAKSSEIVGDKTEGWVSFASVTVIFIRCAIFAATGLRTIVQILRKWYVQITYQARDRPATLLLTETAPRDPFCPLWTQSPQLRRRKRTMNTKEEEETKDPTPNLAGLVTPRQESKSGDPESKTLVHAEDPF